ncbi:hypothetical protein CCR78_07565 [Rhodovulum imhoffii]|nr:hypothetical protein [Rhodovulum imhoffii]
MVFCAVSTTLFASAAQSSISIWLLPFCKHPVVGPAMAGKADSRPAAGLMCFIRAVAPWV